ncbi:hypothetical protein [Ferruginibacter sp. SUN106]|uniref:hypothetical protein n=1 Tax=Ferruginibacter sp. SUN106 TaxID=2978348 RepID=UPI003D369640
MKKIYYCLLLLLLPCSLLAQEWKIFNDTACAFTAKYPATWTKRMNETKRVFFTSPAENAADSFYENVNVNMIKNTAYGTTVKIKQAIPAVLDNLVKSVDNFTKLTERYFKWNDGDACELIYTCNAKNSALSLRVIQWFGFSKGRMYTATYTALAGNTSNAEPAQKILDSIKFR